jgi:putative transposase
LAAVATRVPALEDPLPLYFRLWRLDGTWERMHAALRKRVLVRLKWSPSAQRGHIVDSQSIKTTGVGGEGRGYEVGKS